MLNLAGLLVEVIPFVRLTTPIGVGPWLLPYLPLVRFLSLIAIVSLNRHSPMFDILVLSFCAYSLHRQSVDQ